jgi:hypothetical protein
MVNQKKVTNLWRERGVLNYSMSNDVDKSGQSCGSKLRMDDGDRVLFKRRFYMNVGIMWRARSGQPGVTSGTSERCGIARRGGF